MTGDELDALLAQVARDGEETRKTLEGIALEALLASLEPTICPYCGRRLESEEASE